MLRLMPALVAAAWMPVLANAQSTEKRPGADDKNAPVRVSAERMSGRPDREIILEENVEITRGELTINADKATYDVLQDEVDATGNVRMSRFKDRYAGDEIRLKIDAGQGYVTNPSYKLELNNAQGRGERIDFESQERAVITEGTYSTCEGPDPDWYLKASRLNLDTARDVGTASTTIVYFKGVPILGTPAMSFPLSDARKSGFLPPTIGTTSKGGLEIMQPYYFNIAPNRDLTLYPNLISRRGLQLGAEGRYLGETYAGQTRAEILPDDRQAGITRYAVSSTHTQTLAPGLAFGWNINTASDNNYPTDFSHSTTGTIQRLLLRDVNLNYSSSFWSAGLRATNYQVLQDPAAPIERPYDRMPQVNFHAGRQDLMGFDWAVDSEVTRFTHPDQFRLTGEPITPGNRIVVNPKFSYPIIQPGFFITPKVSLHATKYYLDDTVPGMPSEPSRVVPTFSIDSGLVFERDTQFFGRAMSQTLEPRLFYVYTPFRDQSRLPNFDSALADLSFAQLFSENRFVGNDRISDANQLTGALVSRYIESSGAERMRFAIGQRFYFEDQRVTLPPFPPTQAVISNDSRSDLLLSASGQITPAIGIDTNVQYSENLSTTQRASHSIRWQPAPKKVLNLQYRRDLLNNLEQVDVSAQWPIARRWYGVGRINYSLPDDKVAEGLLGVEYKADCWIFRVVSQQTATGTGQSSTSLFFQLELTGLARVGSNPLEVLRTSIPGYQLISTPSNP
ncbi:LPS-assembly protein LptD [Noviherbaspirillum massiliense]|uniref:LPS-assembly protein LptD n=1 Tax=Noviherbaspirillum massiliense TaxID=1465823 RepID=UPI0002F91A6B|nr:LPS-assembly protein LptD [Noviherbaspirillum massiliense]